MIGRDLYFTKTKTGEDRLIIFFVIFSTVLHIGFFSLDHVKFLDMPEPIVDEWAIDTDILGTNDMDMPQPTTIPDAKQEEKVEIPANLLPQLPKTFNLQEAPKAEDDAVAPTKEKPKAEGENKTEPVPQAPVIENKKELTNVIAMKDAMKRLALERLRQENKEKKELKSPDTSDLARIGEELAKRSTAGTGEIGLGLEKKYGAILRKSISQHYTLPQTFTSSIEKLRVIIAITVNERGELMTVTVHQSSNDKIFDDYTVQAAKAAAPYQKPPLSLVGKEIHLVFSR